MLLLLTMDIFGIFRLKNARRPVDYIYTIGIMLIIMQGVLMRFYVQGNLSFPFNQQTIALQGKNASSRVGNLYMLPLGTTWMNQADLGISPAVVYENGVPLAFPNSMHQEIRDDGNGRYSIWNGYLYFSSSDNSDPRTNGRVYEIKWPNPIPPFLQWLSYLVGIAGILVFLVNSSQ
jgi:hypothetical protein